MQKRCKTILNSASTLENATTSCPVTWFSRTDPACRTTLKDPVEERLERIRAVFAMLLLPPGEEETLPDWAEVRRAVSQGGVGRAVDGDVLVLVRFGSLTGFHTLQKFTVEHWRLQTKVNEFCVASKFALSRARSQKMDVRLLCDYLGPCSAPR